MPLASTRARASRRDSSKKATKRRWNSSRQLPHELNSSEAHVDSCEWVLDTWLLEVAQTPSDPRSLDALALLHQIKARHRIAIDHDREIWRQYTKHVQANSHVGVWVRFMIGTSNKIFWRAGRVSSRHEDGLVSILRFDRADLVFVGVASNGPDRLI